MIKAIKDFSQELEKLDLCMEEKGHFTKSDIFNLNLSNFTKKFLIYIFKRSNDITYHYILDNTRYENKYDIEKSRRDLAEIYFKRPENHE